MENISYYELKVNTDDGKTFVYTVDPTGMLINYGSQLNSINIKPIEGCIKKLTKSIIEKMISDKLSVEELDGRTWPYQNLVGKYVDNEGIIYRDTTDGHIYPSIHSSKYLSKHFNEL